MTDEPLFEFTDQAGMTHIVRIIRNYDESGTSLKNALADLQDVKSSENFRKVPLAKLVPIEEPEPEE